MVGAFPGEIPDVFLTMPRWTQDEYAAYLRKVSGAKPEPAFQHEAPRQDAGEKESAGRSHVRITSYRIRCCDIDNITGGAKFLIDSLRYAGVIRDDRPEDITLEVRQRKVTSREQEGTLIEVETP